MPDRIAINCICGGETLVCQKVKESKLSGGVEYEEGETL